MNSLAQALLEWVGDGREYGALSLAFGVAVSTPLVLLALLVLFAVVALYGWYSLSSLPQPWRSLLALLRAAVFALVAFLVCDPQLLARHRELGRHFVLLLFDDSQSMQVRGRDGQSRAERLLMQYEQTQLGAIIGQTHQVARFRFGAGVERLRAVEDLHFDAKRSDLYAAVDGALARMAGSSIAAVILFSDGVQQSEYPASLSGLDVPIFTVGVEPDTLWTSLALESLSVSRTVFDQSPVAVVAYISARGMGGREAVLEIVDGARVVASKALVLQGGVEQSTRLEFVPTRRGFLRYTARVRLADGDDYGGSGQEDLVSEDNTRAFAVDNRQRVYRILYFGGRPNWENKFVRRALELDSQLELSSLIRISGAERKFEFRGRETSLANPLFAGFDDEAAQAPRYDEAVFLRLGLEADELAHGYPRAAAALYPFDLVIWGDIERSFFSETQLALTADFVGQRGGALLLAGGPRGLTEGGYARSLIEPVLPVVLQRSAAAWRGSPFIAAPTIEGVLAGAFDLDADPERNSALWQRLPPLYGLNESGAARAGATVLAASDDERPFFTWQRYGAGLSAVLATGATWRWQMQSELADEAHERFWRQMLRAMVKDVPDPVVLVGGNEDLRAGEEGRLHFSVRDSLYRPREGLTVRVELRGAGRDPQQLTVEETLSEVGRYQVELPALEPDLYSLELVARDAEERRVAILQDMLLVRKDYRELENARYNPVLLQKLAAQTGGEFLTLDELETLPAKIPWTDVESQRLQRFYLWHFPPFYALVFVLLALEWYGRRRRGQP
jgi:uncharacterized membrane protein